PVVLQTPEGTVRAPTVELAERCAAALARADPLVRKALGTSRAPPEIELVAKPTQPGPIKGYNTKTRIVLQSTEGLEESLCHELVHWHSVGRWDRLPYGLEQGLAIVLSMILTAEDENGTPLERAPDGKHELIETVLDLDVHNEFSSADP